jgi:hypothetical protein
MRRNRQPGDFVLSIGGKSVGRLSIVRFPGRLTQGRQPGWEMSIHSAASRCSCMPSIPGLLDAVKCIEVLLWGLQQKEELFPANTGTSRPDFACW